jgi:hypothetical protein
MTVKPVRRALLAARIVSRAAGGRADGGEVGFDAYHGSPHDFDEFDMSKIGTGEGNQSYGHGLYFAEKEDVAKSYRTRDDEDVHYDGQPLYAHAKATGIPEATIAAPNIADAISSGQDPAQAIDNEVNWRRSLVRQWADKHHKGVPGALEMARRQEEAAQWLERLDPGKFARSKGHMYHVRLNADPDHFLHWDRMFDEQHPEVQRRVLSMFNPQWHHSVKNMDGQNLHKFLKDMMSAEGGETKAAKAAAALKQAGIPGIRYLDGVSRSKGSGSHNFVVFDDRLAKVRRKYEQGGAIGNALRVADDVSPGFDVYHGSPHQFDRFDMSKIGTGEGAQAYGHGLYFAEHEPVAESYLGPQADWKYGGKKGQTIYDRLQDPRLERGLDNEGWSKLNAQRSFWEQVALGRAPRQLVEDAVADPEEHGEHYSAYAKTLKTEKFKRSGANMYHVRLNADPDHFLNWDKKISEQHPHVQGAVKSIFNADWYNDIAGKTGGELHDYLNSLHARHGREGAPVETARKLREAGLAGIRYLDQGSRSSGKGSHNFVVFSDKVPQIKRRYAKGGEV